MEHIEEGYDCWCIPKVTLAENPTNGEGDIITHHDVLLVLKKPVEVTAKVWDGRKKTFEELMLWDDEVFWLHRHIPPYFATQNAPDFWNTYNLKIKTLEGDMLVCDGDYIIRGVNGEFYTCKPDIFHKTYDIVEGEK
jgi:hypothetical protein